MSSFTTPLVVTPLPDGKYWRLLEEFDYHVGSKDSDVFVHVPKGFVTDFASIPRFLWFLPPWAKYNKAPVLHDCLYRTKKLMGQTISRKRADSIFLEAMLVDFRCHKAIGVFIAYLEYFGVRCFAWLAWKDVDSWQAAENR